MTTSTKYMNSKRRVIMQSDRGAFFVRDGDKKLYGTKAHFKKMSKGPKKLTTNMTDNVPLAIRPARRGAPQGPRQGKVLRAMWNQARPAMKFVSPGGTQYKTKKRMDMAAMLKFLTAASPNKKNPIK